MAEKVGFEPACRMICGAKMRFNVRFYDAKAGICDHITCSFREYGVIVGSKNRRCWRVHRRPLLCLVIYILILAAGIGAVAVTHDLSDGRLIDMPVDQRGSHIMTQSVDANSIKPCPDL